MLWRVLLAGLIGLWVLSGAASSRADEGARWTGVFAATEGGREVTLSIQLFRDKVEGRLTGWSGAEQRLSARREGAGAVGTLTAPDGFAYAALESEGDALTLAIIPAGPDGAADYARSQKLVLARISATPLASADGNRPRPLPAPGTDIDIVTFLVSYQDWPEAEAGRAVARIVPAERRKLIAFFGALSAEVYLLACEAGLADIPADLRERQTLDCAALLAQAEAAGARFDRAALRAEAGMQAKGLVRLIQCDRGSLPGDRCKDAGTFAAEGLKTWSDAGAVIARHSGGAGQ